jgi:hypothetical protein
LVLSFYDRGDQQQLPDTTLLSLETMVTDNFNHKNVVLQKDSRYVVRVVKDKNERERERGRERREKREMEKVKSRLFI